MFDPFLPGRLREFRGLIDRFNGDFDCTSCGGCCIIGGKVMLEIEVEEAMKRYGPECFDTETYPFTVLRRNGMYSACLEEGALEKVTTNLEVLAAKKSGLLSDEVPEPGDEARCGIYEERFIICRLYPQFPISGTCLNGIKAKGLEERELALLTTYLGQYVYNLKREMIESQAVELSSIVPETSAGFIRIAHNSMTHYKRVSDQVGSFWDMWFYGDKIELENWAGDFVDAMDGVKTVAEIAIEIDRPLRDTLLTTTTMLAFGLLKVPDSFVLPVPGSLEISVKG